MCTSLFVKPPEMLYSRLLLDYHPFELTDSVMFFGELSPFCEKKNSKENSVIRSLFKKKKSPNFSKTFPKIAKNCLQYDQVLQILYFSYF